MRTMAAISSGSPRRPIGGTVMRCAGRSGTPGNPRWLSMVPGTIESQRGLPGVPDRPAHRQTVPPIGRRGEPEEIAAMVRMLCGPDARYITGQSIHLNGGGFMP